MSSKPANPLSRNDHKALLELQAMLLDLQQQISKAQACGVDCDQLNALRQHYDAQTVAYLQNYFADPANMTE